MNSNFDVILGRDWCNHVSCDILYSAGLMKFIMVFCNAPRDLRTVHWASLHTAPLAFVDHYIEHPFAAGATQEKHPDLCHHKEGASCYDSSLGLQQPQRHLQVQSNTQCRCTKPSMEQGWSKAHDEQQCDIQDSSVHVVDLAMKLYTCTVTFTIACKQNDDSETCLFWHIPDLLPFLLFCQQHTESRQADHIERTLSC